MKIRSSRSGVPNVTWRVFAAVLAAPVAWTLQVCIAEALVAQSCFLHDAPMRASYAGAALDAVIALSCVALVAGMTGTFWAWRNWRGLLERPGEILPQGDANLRAGETFIAKVGFMSSLLFLFALVATDVAAVLVSAC
ncbi:hypothetical protein LJR230_004400 [Trinickia sp. LjRoot230]|uniref:hypothetical protein n=1 Tax=Trinickia sp. LjRoot230 TaxID=3342288 RepID=UPI003ED11BEF